MVTNLHVPAGHLQAYKIRVLNGVSAALQGLSSFCGVYRWSLEGVPRGSGEPYRVQALRALEDVTF